MAADGTVRAEATPSRPLILLRVPRHPFVGFTVASPVIGAGGVPLRIVGMSYRAPVHPWRLRLADQGGSLHEPMHGHALSVQGGGAAELLPVAADPNGAELMRFETLPAEQVTAELEYALATLLTLLPADLNGPDMLDVLARVITAETAVFAQAVLRLLPPDQIMWLGGTLLGLPVHLARFAAAFPDDIWARDSMPSLRSWLQTRQGPPTALLPPACDFLAEAGLNGQPTSAAHLLNMAARAAVPPRRSVCVVATARNEGLYLLEWIAYHRIIGAEAIVIYSNDNSDGSDELLRALAEAGEIKWIDSRLDPGGAAQPKAYGHAFGVLPDTLDYRWTLVIDLDEFFGFNADRFSSLPDYLAWQETQPVDAITLNWLVFGSGGATGWVDAPMVERFTKRLPWIDSHIKSLNRSNRVVQSHPHHAVFGPFGSAVTRDSGGKPYEFAGGFSHAKVPLAQDAWVSHYFLKSADEFVWKFSRNRGDHALVKGFDPAQIEPGFVDMFLKQHTSPTMTEDGRTAACAPGLCDEIARLRAVPSVAAAEQAIVTEYRRVIRDLVGSIRTEANFLRDGSPFAALAGLCS